MIHEVILTPAVDSYLSKYQRPGRNGIAEMCRKAVDALESSSKLKNMKDIWVLGAENENLSICEKFYSYRAKKAENELPQNYDTAFPPMQTSI